MKKIIFYLLTMLIIITGCSYNKSSSENKNSREGINMSIVINDETYILNLENNETSKEFSKLISNEYIMEELNGNEKYVYLDFTLPTNSFNPKQIQKGDVMLFGNNCLVIFYKTFNTSYSYTKIGHIDNLKDLSNGSIVVKFKGDNNEG